MAETSLPPEAYALLEAIAGPESRGAYTIIYGGSHFKSFDDHPRKYVTIEKGPNKGEKSSAAGKYQFIAKTWDKAAKALGLTDFSPDSQDRAAWWLAQHDYRARTGNNLLSDLRSSDPATLAAIGKALSGTWTSLPSGIEQGQSGGVFATSYNAALEKVLGHPVPKVPIDGATGVIKTGSKGESVRDLQQRLHAAGFDPGAVDGVFGAKTAKAVRAFQAAKGLDADGIAGRQTWAALTAVDRRDIIHEKREAALGNGPRPDAMPAPQPAFRRPVVAAPPAPAPVPAYRRPTVPPVDPAINPLAAPAPLAPQATPPRPAPVPAFRQRLPVPTPLAPKPEPTRQVVPAPGTAPAKAAPAPAQRTSTGIATPGVTRTNTVVGGKPVPQAGTVQMPLGARPSSVPPPPPIDLNTLGGADARSPADVPKYITTTERVPVTSPADARRKLMDIHDLREDAQIEAQSGAPAFKTVTRQTLNPEWVAAQSAYAPVQAAPTVQPMAPQPRQRPVGIAGPAAAAPAGIGIKLPSYSAASDPRVGQRIATENNGTQVVGQRVNNSARGYTVTGDEWFNSVRGL